MQVLFLAKSLFFKIQREARLWDTADIMNGWEMFVRSREKQNKNYSVYWEFYGKSCCVCAMDKLDINYFGENVYNDFLRAKSKA